MSINGGDLLIAPIVVFYISIGLKSIKQLMLNLKSLRSEPFLWIHLTGIVMFPICLEISMMALSIGDSYPVALELFLLIAIGILPILLMQWLRPFYIFSILFLSVKPETLSDDQRVILSLFKTFKQKLLSAIASVIIFFSLWLLYRLSPLATGVVDFLPQWHILGLSIAILAFLASNLFLQVPLSVLLVLITKQSKLDRVEPYPTEKINRSFAIPGIKVNQILWFLDTPTETL